MTYEEQARFARFRRAEDRARYAAARVLSRTVLGGLLDRDPAALRFDRTCEHCGCANGRPRLVGGDGLEFSVSHAGDRVLLAVSPETRIGVDVEEHGRADVLRGTLSARELTYDLTPDELTVRWTRKEALLKATGHGLSVAPDTVTLSRDGTSLVGWTDPRPGPSQVRFHSLDVGPGYEASVALL
jgi:4'-phosphopantetheinyl transferase